MSVENDSADETGSLYDQDFHRWSQRQADLLRERRFDDLDLPNLVDEVESLGRDLVRELRDRMADVVRLKLLLHALPGEAWAAVWQLRLQEQCRMNRKIVRDAPSLKDRLPEMVADVLEIGRLRSVEELAYAYPKRTFDDVFDSMPPLGIDDLIG